ncbi:hypothetical protein ACLBKS_00100 [Hylemonella sp. W303a]|uniref:hypothetical protein n=1 Tax=Hylemonella sp. W303a TaxID=3389873 RepID=UPI00396B298A
MNQGTTMRHLSIALALVMTATALAMSVASSLTRAETQADKIILAALSVCLVLAVHLLPALTHQAGRLLLIAAPVWLLCLVAAIFGHAVFFMSAWQASADAKVMPTMKAQADAIEDKRQAIEATLSTIRARPTVTVAAQLARAKADPFAAPELVQRLEIELAESQRAARLRDDLVNLASTTVSSAGNRAVADPVMQAITRATGWPEDRVLLGFNGLLAALVEFLGCLFWFLGIAPQRTASTLATYQPDLDRIRFAVERGECRPSISSIREYLRCSQARAMELRRLLVKQTT